MEMPCLHREWLKRQLPLPHSTHILEQLITCHGFSVGLHTNGQWSYMRCMSAFSAQEVDA
eukprot:517352-Amphidinium_carterae.1